MTRYIKISLVFFMAFWGLAGGLSNIEHAAPAASQVQAAIAMEGTQAGSEHWRAIDSPLLGWIGAGAITLAKLATGFLCLIGILHMWRARSMPAVDFNAAKSMAILGCGIMLTMLFGLFVAVGEGYFFLTQSAIGAHALPTAFRYIGTTGVITIYLAIAD